MDKSKEQQQPWNNDLHTARGCDTKTFGSRTDPYLTILDEIGSSLNIFSSNVTRDSLASLEICLGPCAWHNPF